MRVRATCYYTREGRGRQRNNNVGETDRNEISCVGSIETSDRSNCMNGKPLKHDDDDRNDDGYVG